MATPPFGKGCLVQADKNTKEIMQKTDVFIEKIKDEYCMLQCYSIEN